MKKILGLILLLGLLIPVLTASARPAGIVILVDLSHGQGTNGIETMMKMVPEASWILLVPSEDDANALPQTIKNMAMDIWIGDFASVDLASVDVIIIGQPTSMLSPEEIQAITSWFTDGNKVLWIAADSDYPAGGSEQSQVNANAILESLGSNLRMDYVSVEDPVSNCQRSYRVVGIVNPSPGAEAVGFGAYKVLFHGPGVVAWVDENGQWHKLSENEKPANTYILVTTTEHGQIVEHQPKAPGEPGNIGQAYAAGDTGVFPLMAAQVMNYSGSVSVVMVSGETPYGGYQPITTWLYYGVKLDGPTFFRNVILWATGYMGYLKPLVELEKASKNIASNVSALIEEKIKPLEDKITSVEDRLSSLQTNVNNLTNSMSKIKDLSDKVSGLESNVGDLSKKVSELESNINGLDEKVSGLEGKIGTINGYAVAGLGLSVIAILIAIAAILVGRKSTEKKVAGKMKK